MTCLTVTIGDSDWNVTSSMVTVEDSDWNVTSLTVTVGESCFVTAVSQMEAEGKSPQ